MALAIDVTQSMGNAFRIDRDSNRDSYNRLDDREAGRPVDLVDILTADDNGQTAVGLVPWNYLVRLDADTRTRWEQQRWASLSDPTLLSESVRHGAIENTARPRPWFPDRNGAEWWG